MTKPERLAEFRREVRVALDAERTARNDAERERNARPASLDAEIGNLTDAIASGLLRASPALAARLHAAESERAGLASRTETRTAKIADLLPRIAQDYAALINDLEDALQRDVDRARGNLRAVLGDVRLTPDPTGEFLMVEGYMQAAQLLSATGPLFRKSGSGGAIWHTPPPGAIDRDLISNPDLLGLPRRVHQRHRDAVARRIAAARTTPPAAAAPCRVTLT